MSAHLEALEAAVKLLKDHRDENIPLEELFQKLRCTRQGLTTTQAYMRLEFFGLNKLEAKAENNFLKFIGFLLNPLSLVMVFAAAIMAIAAIVGRKPPEWKDFVVIFLHLLINSTISFFVENNAANTAATLMARLAPKAKVLRDGRWSVKNALILVPGDIISIKLGDIVPADARLLDGDPLLVDESAFTGESLPVTKNTGDMVYHRSTCKQGEIQAIIIATGVHTCYANAGDLAVSTTQVGQFQKVLADVRNFCICSIVVAIFVDCLFMFSVQRRVSQLGIENLVVIMIGGIPLAMSNALSWTMANGSHRLSQQGAITKRMTAIEEMARMDLIWSAITGILTLNKPEVKKDLIKVFAKDITPDHVILMGARASRTENQNAIDAAIVEMLPDPEEARAGIEEIHFLPFNPTDRRTAATYSDSRGKWYRVSKGAPEQILNLVTNKSEIKRHVRSVIGNFAEHGLRSLAIAIQEVPEGSKESSGGPWHFIGLLPFFYPPRPESAQTIRRALNLGISVQMITGDQLGIGKETARRVGLGTNMYPSSAVLGQNNDELVEKADGFVGAFPEEKRELLRRLKNRRQTIALLAYGVSDVPALKQADIGISPIGSTDAVRSASDVLVTEPALTVVMNAVVTSRQIFEQIRNFAMHAVSINIHIVLGFTALQLLWEFNFSLFMVQIIAIINHVLFMTISIDRVNPSQQPFSWNLAEVFTTGISLGAYQACITVIFFWAACNTDFFPTRLGVETLEGMANYRKLVSAVYLQVSTANELMVFATRSRSSTYIEKRPGVLMIVGCIIALLVSTLITVYVNWEFASVEGIGWGWASVIVVGNVIFFVPLDFIKFLNRYAFSGRGRDVELRKQTAGSMASPRGAASVAPPHAGQTVALPDMVLPFVFDPVGITTNASAAEPAASSVGHVEGTSSINSRGH